MQATNWRAAVARAPREFLYIFLGAPLGLLWFVGLVTAIAVGIATSVVIVGIPMLAVTLLLWRWGANVERERAALVLGVPIARPPRRTATGGPLARWEARATDRAAWKELAYMLLLGPVGVTSGSIVVAAWSVVLAALAAPVFAFAAPDKSLLGGLGAVALVGVVAAGLVVGAIAVVVTRGFAVAVAALARSLLAPDERALLAARVDTLEATRAGAVVSADARLRRLERDLHDGAQHRLAYIAMELDRARAKLGDDPNSASELLTRAHEESKRAMVELRDLVRGVHPSVLTDRGLDAAVSGLAERCRVPVEIDVRLDSRPPTAVETAAYYVVAEALTNVAKHADARSAAVRIHREDPNLQIEVRDDGRGGARRTPGSGLEGLAQRVEALDGTLAIDSPTGGPTTVRAELPCGS
jgi:signal transduction histidine kinase